jgi:hypothetical protein
MIAGGFEIKKEDTMSEFDFDLDHLDFDAAAAENAKQQQLADEAAAAAAALPDEDDCAGGACKI